MKHISIVKSERWLNPFWFPSESKVRFGLVLLTASCLSVFVIQRGLEALDYHPLAWIWLAFVLIPPTQGLIAQSMRVLRHCMTLTPVETVSPALTKTVANLINDPWLNLKPPPQIWVTPHILSPLSLGLGHRQHIILPQVLLDYYQSSNEEADPRELEAVLRHELAHIKNGDLRLKGLAYIAFLAAFWSYLGLLFLIFWLVAWGDSAGPVINAWEAFFLPLALFGSFSLYRTALHQRELYADIRVTLSMETDKVLLRALSTVNDLLKNLAWSAKAPPANCKLLGFSLAATDIRQQIPIRWWPSIRWPAWLQALFQTHPTQVKREHGLAIFQAVDQRLVFLSGFLPVLVVGLLFSLLPKEALNTALLDGLSYLWPRLAQLVAEGQEASRVLVASVSPGLGTTISQTTLVDGLQAAIRLPLALWVLTLVLVGPVARGRGFSTLGVSVWFVAGVLAAQTTSLETLGLLIRPEGGGYWAILLGYGQAMIGTLSFAVMVFFYVFALRGLLRRYPSPPQFRRWLRWTTALFIGVVAWESLGAVPLGSTVEMLPYLAAPKIVKWLLILIAVAWLGLTTRRRCPACHVYLTMKDEEDISSSHDCGRCNYPLYKGWTEPTPNEVAAGQVPHWLAWASDSTADEIVAGLRRIGRQARLSLEALQEVVAQVARDWSDKLHVHHPPQVWQELKRRVINKVRGVWSGLFPLQQSTGLARPRPLIVVSLVQGTIGVCLLLGSIGFFFLRGMVAFVAPDKLSLLYFEPELTAAKFIGISDLVYSLFMLVAMGFLIYLLLRGTWEGRPWAYAINIVLAGLLCATIVLTVIGVPFLLYLLRPETKRYFHLNPDSAVPLAPYLLLALYTVICTYYFFLMVQSSTNLLTLLDPATYDKFRIYWIGALLLESDFPLNVWFPNSTFAIIIPLIWVLVAFGLAQGAKRGWSWAYLTGVGLTAVAAFIPLFSIQAIFFLRYLLKPEVRRFYGIGWQRPLVVHLASTFFLLVGFSNLDFIAGLMFSIGILFSPYGGEAFGPSYTVPRFSTLLNISMLTLLWALINFFLAWGNMKGKRWAYVLTLGVLLITPLIRLGIIVANLSNPALLVIQWLDLFLSPLFWPDALVGFLSVIFPIPAMIAMLHPQVRRYFGVTSERPMIIDLITMLLLFVGLLSLIFLNWAAIFSATVVAIGGLPGYGGRQFIPYTEGPIAIFAVGVLLSLNLGDFLIIPSFILAAAIWQGRAWAYRACLRVFTLATASLILTPIALPILFVLNRPVIRRLYAQEDEHTRHPFIDNIIFFHWLNLVLWSVLALVGLYIGIIPVISPVRAQDFPWLAGLALTVQETFWVGVLELYRLPPLIGAIALTVITIRGVKQGRPWAYPISLGLAAYGLIGVHFSVGVDIRGIIINFILIIISISLLITLILRPTRQHFSGEVIWLPSAALTITMFLWLLPLQFTPAVLIQFLSVIIAQFTYQPGGEPLDSATLFINYIAVGTFVAISLLVGVFGIGMAKGLWSGQRWAYLFTLATLALACLAIVPAIITLPLLIALWGRNHWVYFANHKKRPVVVEGISFAYAGAAWLCLLVVFIFIFSGANTEISLLTVLTLPILSASDWQAVDFILIIVALGIAISCSLLAVAIWRGRLWAHRVSIGLGVLGVLTVTGAPIAVPVTIALRLPTIRCFFQHNESVSKLVCPNCSRSPIPGAYFCSQCGAKLGTRCTTCHSHLPLGAAFCPSCGMQAKAVIK